jgi:hypothetical protein
METNTMQDNSIMSKSVKFLLVLIVVSSLFAINYYRDISKLQENPNKANEEKAAMILEKVGKIIDLPKDEYPAVAVISDMAPFRDNPFFAKAEVGDYVIVYTIARKSFIYNPTSNMIVEVASLNIGK